jgi:FkbM family methyltransferase
MRKFIQKLLFQLGYDIKKVPSGMRKIAGSQARAIGLMKDFLEDIKARGLTARGIVDVGANRGDWTLIAVEVFPRAKILMVEPLIETLPTLQSMAEKNSDLRVAPYAVGKEKGVFVQTIWEDLVGSSFLPQEGSADAESKIRRETQVTTLDSLVLEHGFVPEIVKLDIQGWELLALEGAATLFGKTEIFILEVSLYEFSPGTPVLQEVINFMNTRGYDTYDVCGYSRRPLDGALGQVDIAFARRDGILRKSSNWG